MLKKILLSSVAATSVFGGMYLVPQEYDNMVMSTKSESFGLITQAVATMSNNTYVIGGKNVQMRCLTVPKLNCTAAVPQINANISEISLKRPGTEELVQTFQVDLRIEEDANNWYLCGGAYGGMVWDDSQMTTSQDPVTGDTQLSYKYEPNTKLEEYYYFTNQANTSVQSYMAITYNQVCQ